MKSNEKLEMKFHLKAKYHIHSNLHVVKWSDKDGPPYSCFLAYKIFQTCVVITTTVSVLFLAGYDFTDTSINVLLQLTASVSRRRSMVQSGNISSKMFKMRCWEKLNKSTCMYILIQLSGDVSDPSIIVVLLASRSTLVVSVADKKKGNRTLIKLFSLTDICTIIFSDSMTIAVPFG